LHKKITTIDYEKINNSSKYFDEILANEIDILWKDEDVKEIFQKSNQYQLLESTEYFFGNIKRIGKIDYLPTDQDIILCRTKTTGVTSFDYKIKDTKFTLLDVGGQRTERKKWIHYFDNASCIVFVTSLAEYDLTLYEDETTKRMHESLLLYEEICNSKYFQKAKIVLFLNKDDIFREKIKKTDLKVCFQEYNGGCNYEESLNFIKEAFTQQSSERDDVVYVNVGSATDSDVIKKFFLYL